MFPNDFPQLLLKRAVSLTEWGISNYAWGKEDAIKAILFLLEKGYAVIGGDVYKKEEGKFVPTYDSWYINRGKLHWDEYIFQCKEKSISYIQNYNKEHGDLYYYVLVTTTNIEII